MSVYLLVNINIFRRMLKIGGFSIGVTPIEKAGSLFFVLDFVTLSSSHRIRLF